MGPLRLARLLEQLDGLPLTPARIVDLGSGPGGGAAAVGQRRRRSGTLRRRWSVRSSRAFR
jgi:hypothetical protein